MNLKANCFIYIFCILLFPVIGIKAQETIKRPVNPQPFSVVFKTNPLPILWGPVYFTSEYRIVNEFVVGPNQSSQIGISFLGKSPIFTLIDNAMSQNGTLKIMVRGIRVQLSHRFYLNRKDTYAPEGFYLGPLFSYSTARFTNKHLNIYNVYIRSTHINLNMIGGYQLILPGDFVIDMFSGFGYKENTWEEHTPPTITPINTDDFGPSYNSNFKIILGFNIGKAF
ncbi:MAG: hypothetical protein H0V01_14130 [Bacteroidetes bacterium]|nr:hypothetical protein [Bacteroidota bacterium]HET6245120.1 hypothetical protein [Bacteroidia bacterium]